MSAASLKVEVQVEQKQAEMPAFVIVPDAKVARWKLTATTTVEATLDGVPMGRRSLKRWDAYRWFIELPRGVLETVGKSPGDRASLEIALAPAELPAELQELIDTVPQARTHWDARTDAQRRMLREYIFTAKTPATRERRARDALLPAATPPAPPIKGLPSKPRAIVVRIIGRHLPGRNCGPYTDIMVSLARKVGCDPGRGFRADVREAKWETEIEVREKDGVPAFGGPAVNGPPGERFLYLTWIGRLGGARPAMFRRAKLRLDAVPADVLAGSLRSGLLVGRLDLTASDGMPVCASVRPPEIRWTCS